MARPTDQPKEDLREILAQRLDQFFGSLAAPELPIRVLEVGCADGYASEVLYHRLMARHGVPGTRLYTLDIDPQQVLAARRRLRGNGCSEAFLLLADLYRLPAPAECFDCLIALNMFFWIDRPRFFVEVHRVLKPGGKLLVYDRLPTYLDAPIPRICLALSRDEVARCRPAAGLAPKNKVC